MRRIAATLTLFAAGGFVPAAAQDETPQTVEIKEYEVPWGAQSRPRDPYVAPDGKVWFVGQSGNYIANLDPSSGEFKRYEIEEGTNPHNLIVDEKGIVWYAGNRNARVGRLDPATGEIKTYMMPTPETARDPHTLVRKDDTIWFTLQQSNKIGRLNRVSGEVRLIDVPTPRARPYGIWLNSQAMPWIVLFGTNKLATIDPATLALREVALPREGARPRRIAITSDDAVWYIDYAEGMLGRYDPKTGAFKEWTSPSGAQSRGYAMTVDDMNRIWYVESGVQPNKLVGFDPKTEQFFSVTEIPSGGGTVRHMVYHQPTGLIWFGTDAGTIGSAKVK